MPYLLVKILPAKLALAFQTCKEMVRLVRKPRTKVADWEISLNDEFMKVFSMMNGNKPLTEEQILPPVTGEEVAPVVDRIN